MDPGCHLSEVHSFSGWFFGMTGGFFAGVRLFSCFFKALLKPSKRGGREGALPGLPPPHPAERKSHSKQRIRESESEESRISTERFFKKTRSGFRMKITPFPFCSHPGPGGPKPGRMHEQEQKRFLNSGQGDVPVPDMTTTGSDGLGRFLTVLKECKKEF